MINKVILVGRLGQDPELRETNNGDAVANFAIATSRRWKDASGNNEEKTEWHQCTAWRKLAEVVGSYVKKGTLLYVEGRIEHNQWEDKEGNTRYGQNVVVHEMQMLEGKKEG